MTEYLYTPTPLSAISRPPKRGEGSRLGNVTNNASTYDDLVTRRLALQDHAQYLIGSDALKNGEDLPRVCTCYRTPAAPPDATDKRVQVVVNSDGSTTRARYRNLMLCGSVWSCPFCAAKIAEERRRRLSAALDNAYADGYGVYMPTFTFAHRYGDDLASLKTSMVKAFAKFRTGRAWKELEARFGILAYVRDTEVTYGLNGFHPHMHALFITSSPLGVVDRAALDDLFKLRWLAVLESVGLSASYEKGLVISDSHADISDYLAKVASIDDSVDLSQAAKRASARASKAQGYELTYQSTKTAIGNHKTLSMWQCLELYALDSDAVFRSDMNLKTVSSDRLGAAFVTYSKVFHGSMMLVASKSSPKTGKRGFWDLLRVEDVDAAAEIEALEYEPMPEVLSVSLDTWWWWLILAMGARGDLLGVAAATCSEDEIWNYIRSLVPAEPDEFLTDEQIIELILWRCYKDIKVFKIHHAPDHNRDWHMQHVYELISAQNVTHLDLSHEYQKMLRAKLRVCPDYVPVTASIPGKTSLQEVRHAFIQPALF